MSLVSNEVNRRRLLGMLGVAGVGATAAAMAPAAPFVPASPALASTGHEDHTTTTSKNQEEMTADEMDAHHESGIKSFPAETKGKGGQQLE